MVPCLSVRDELRWVLLEGREPELLPLLMLREGRMLFRELPLPLFEGREPDWPLFPWEGRVDGRLLFPRSVLSCPGRLPELWLPLFSGR